MGNSKSKEKRQYLKHIKRRQVEYYKQNKELIDSNEYKVYII